MPISDATRLCNVSNVGELDPLQQLQLHEHSVRSVFDCPYFFERAPIAVAYAIDRNLTKNDNLGGSVLWLSASRSAHA
jgi:hypothetical protein